MRDPVGPAAAPRHRRIAVAAIGILLAGCVAATPPATPSATPVPSAASPGPEGPEPVVIDTDLSSDDTMAIALLLRDPSVDVIGITVTGTGLVHCAQGLQVLTSFLAAVDVSDVPSTCGQDQPLGGTHEFPKEWRAAADRGYGLSIPSVPVTMTATKAPQMLADLATAAPRPITLVALGPLTNVALALRADAGLATRIGRIVAMAGAVDVPGNVDLGQGLLPAEWNVYADPPAADEVFRSGVPITLVPLDATNHAPISAELIANLESDHAAAPADIAFELLARGALTSADSLWDPLAAVITLEPEVATFETIPLAVITAEGPDSGRTKRTTGGTAVNVAVSADRAAFEAQFLDALRVGSPRPVPFTLAGTMGVTFDGEACVDTRPATVTPGDWRIESESTASGTLVMALVRFHEGAGWDDLVAWTRTAPDPTAQPPFVDALWAQVFERPGKAATIMTFDPGRYAFACLVVEVAKPLAIPASGLFTVAP